MLKDRAFVQKNSLQNAPVTISVPPTPQLNLSESKTVSELLQKLNASFDSFNRTLGSEEQTPLSSEERARILIDTNVAIWRQTLQGSSYGDQARVPSREGDRYQWLNYWLSQLQPVTAEVRDLLSVVEHHAPYQYFNEAQALKVCADKTALLMSAVSDPFHDPLYLVLTEALYDRIKVNYVDKQVEAALKWIHPASLGGMTLSDEGWPSALTDQIQSRNHGVDGQVSMSHAVNDLIATRLAMFDERLVRQSQLAVEHAIRDEVDAWLARLSIDAARLTSLERIQADWLWLKQLLSSEQIRVLERDAIAARNEATMAACEQKTQSVWRSEVDNRPAEARSYDALDMHVGQDIRALFAQIYLKRAGFTYLPTTQADKRDYEWGSGLHRQELAKVCRQVSSALPELPIAASAAPTTPASTDIESGSTPSPASDAAIIATLRNLKQTFKTRSSQLKALDEQDGGHRALHYFAVGGFWHELRQTWRSDNAITGEDQAQADWRYFKTLFPSIGQDLETQVKARVGRPDLDRFVAFWRQAGEKLAANAREAEIPVTYDTALSPHLEKLYWRWLSAQYGISHPDHAPADPAATPSSTVARNLQQAWMEQLGRLELVTDAENPPLIPGWTAPASGASWHAFGTALQTAYAQARREEDRRFSASRSTGARIAGPHAKIRDGQAFMTDWTDLYMQQLGQPPLASMGWYGRKSLIATYLDRLLGVTTAGAQKRGDLRRNLDELRQNALNARSTLPDYMRQCREVLNRHLDGIDESAQRDEEKIKGAMVQFYLETLHPSFTYKETWPAEIQKITLGSPEDVDLTLGLMLNAEPRVRQGDAACPQDDSDDSDLTLDEAWQAGRLCQEALAQDDTLTAEQKSDAAIMLMSYWALLHGELKESELSTYLGEGAASDALQQRICSRYRTQVLGITSDEDATLKAFEELLVKPLEMPPDFMDLARKLERQLDIKPNAKILVQPTHITGFGEHAQYVKHISNPDRDIERLTMHELLKHFGELKEVMLQPGPRATFGQDDEYKNIFGKTKDRPSIDWVTITSAEVNSIYQRTMRDAWPLIARRQETLIMALLENAGCSGQIKAVYRPKYRVVANHMVDEVVAQHRAFLVQADQGWWRVDFHPQNTMPYRTQRVDTADNADRYGQGENFDAYHFVRTNLQQFFYDSVHFGPQAHSFQVFTRELNPDLAEHKYLYFAEASGLKDKFKYLQDDASRYFERSNFWKALWSSLPMMSCVEMAREAYNPDKPIDFPSLFGTNPAESATVSTAEKTDKSTACQLPQVKKNPEVKRVDGPDQVSALSVVFCVADGVSTGTSFVLPPASLLLKSAWAGLIAARGGLAMSLQASKAVLKAGIKRVVKTLMGEIAQEAVSVSVNAVLSNSPGASIVVFRIGSKVAASFKKAARQFFGKHALRLVEAGQLSPTLFSKMRRRGMVDSVPDDGPFMKYFTVADSGQVKLGSILPETTDEQGWVRLNADPKIFMGREGDKVFPVQRMDTNGVGKASKNNWDWVRRLDPKTGLPVGKPMRYTSSSSLRLDSLINAARKENGGARRIRVNFADSETSLELDSSGLIQAKLGEQKRWIVIRDEKAYILGMDAEQVKASQLTEHAVMAVENSVGETRLFYRDNALKPLNVLDMDRDGSVGHRRANLIERNAYERARINPEEHWIGKLTENGPEVGFSKEKITKMEFQDGSGVVYKKEWVIAGDKIYVVVEGAPPYVRPASQLEINDISVACVPGVTRFKRSPPEWKCSSRPGPYDRPLVQRAKSTKYDQVASWRERILYDKRIWGRNAPKALEQSLLPKTVAVELGAPIKIDLVNQHRVFKDVLIEESIDFYNKPIEGSEMRLQYAPESNGPGKYYIALGGENAGMPTRGFDAEDLGIWRAAYYAKYKVEATDMQIGALVESARGKLNKHFYEFSASSYYKADIDGTFIFKDGSDVLNYKGPLADFFSQSLRFDLENPNIVMLKIAAHNFDQPVKLTIMDMNGKNLSEMVVDHNFKGKHLDGKPLDITLEKRSDGGGYTAWVNEKSKIFEPPVGFGDENHVMGALFEANLGSAPTRVELGEMTDRMLRTIGDNATAINDMLPGKPLGSINPTEIFSAAEYLRNQRAAKIGVTVAEEMCDRSLHTKKMGGKSFNHDIDAASFENLRAIQERSEKMWHDVYFKGDTSGAGPVSDEFVFARMADFSDEVKIHNIRYGDSTQTAPLVVTALRKSQYEGRVRVVEKQGLCFVVIGNEPNAFVIDGWSADIYPLKYFNENFKGRIDLDPTGDLPRGSGAGIDFTSRPERWDQDATIKFDLEIKKNNWLDSERVSSVPELDNAVRNFVIDDDAVLTGRRAPDTTSDIDFNIDRVLSEAVGGSGNNKFIELHKVCKTLDNRNNFYFSDEFKPIKENLRSSLGSKYNHENVKNLLHDYSHMAEKNRAFKNMTPKRLETFLAYDLTRSEADRVWMTRSSWRQRFIDVKGDLVANYWKPLKKMAPATLPARPVQGQIAVYRAMPLAEAQSIMADGNLNALDGHLGDYKQAKSYYDTAGEQVLMKFTFREGAHDKLFKANMVAPGANGEMTKYIHGYLAATDSSAVITTGNVSEGKAKGFIGIKSEDGGEGWSLIMGKGDKLAKSKFASLLERVTAIDGPPSIKEGSIEWSPPPPVSEP